MAFISNRNRKPLAVHRSTDEKMTCLKGKSSRKTNFSLYFESYTQRTTFWILFSFVEKFLPCVLFLICMCLPFGHNEACGHFVMVTKFTERHFGLPPSVIHKWRSLLAKSPKLWPVRTGPIVWDLDRSPSAVALRCWVSRECCHDDVSRHALGSHSKSAVSNSRPKTEFLSQVKCFPFLHTLKNFISDTLGWSFSVKHKNQTFLLLWGNGWQLGKWMAV